MDFHLHREGRNEGIFPLEELRRRRLQGELTGSEYVWREGMADWQPLDRVLQENTPRPTPPPPPLPRGTGRDGGTNRIVIWIVAVACGLALIFAVAVVLFVVKFSRKLAPAITRTINQINQATTPANTTAILEASKPVMWTTNTLTESDLQKRRGEFRRRQWLEGYEKRGDRSETCDAEAVDYLTAWIIRNYGGGTDTNSLSTTDWSDKLANDPACTDPLVLTVTGLNCNELHEKTRRLEKALNSFGNSKHRAYPKFCATVNLQDALGNQPQRIAALQASALDLLRESFADGSLEPEDQAECADLLINGWGSAFLYRDEAGVTGVVKGAGEKYQWLALVMEGNENINEAWKARGGGYANTVTQAGWQGFNSHLEKARQCLTEAWQLRPDLPMAPERMMTVSLGSSGIAEMRLWFDRTVSAQLDNRGAWSEMRWGLRPRWYGDLNSMLAFGQMAVDTGRFDTDIPRKFFDVLTDLESEEEMAPGEHIYGRDYVWPTLQRMYEGYIAKAADESAREGWRTTYATVAYLAGKYDVAGKQLAALNWTLRTNNLTAWGRELSLMPGEVAARTGSEAKKAAEAENARNAKFTDQALKLYTELAASANADTVTREYAASRAAEMRAEKQFEAGEWVDFLPKSDTDPLWFYAWDKGHRVVDGGLEVKLGAEGHMCYSRLRVGKSFEVRGGFEVVSSTSRNFQAGLVMGMPDFNSSFNDNNWYAFRMKRNDDERQVVSFARMWSRQEVRRSIALDDHTNTFDFQFHGTSCSATVDGTRVFDHAGPAAQVNVPEDRFLLGLGAYTDNNTTTIVYRNVQVRRLQ